MESSQDEAFQRLPESNLEFLQESRQVTALNDNDGELFEFSRLRDEPLWVVPTVLTADWKNRVAAEGSRRAALISPKFTDILLLRLFNPPEGIQLAATGSDAVYARAAYISWGHLLRRVVCEHLDVEPTELEVNIRPVAGGAAGRFEIFLMDSLENGAGYCRYLATPGVVERQLLGPVRGESPIIDRLREEAHRSVCDSACYDCLRDYGNSSVHALLDWRLAVDLWMIASSTTCEAADINLTTPHWKGAAKVAAISLAQSISGGRACELHSTWGVEVHGRICCAIKHPLWASNHPAIEECERASREITSATVWCSAFDVMRRPGYCLARLD
jgi:hypothetical protein